MMIKLLTNFLFVDILLIEGQTQTREMKMNPKEITRRGNSSERFTIIPKLTGRPERETAIGNDDIINLKIALETSKTLEEFLERV